MISMRGPWHLIMSMGYAWRLPLAVALVATAGCHTVPRHEPRINVPFLPQTQQSHCGVTCLAMAFRHFQIPYDIDMLTTDAWVPALAGSTPDLLADVADAYGLHADLRCLSIMEISETLNGGGLAIAFLPPPPPSGIGHFILITGVSLSSRRIRAHDGKHRHRWTPAPEVPLLSVVLHAARPHGSRTHPPLHARERHNARVQP